MLFLGHPKSLDQFEYSDGDLGDIITSCTSNLSFLGVSGNVKFGSYGSPVKNIKLDQIQGKYSMYTYQGFPMTYFIT